MSITSSLTHHLRFKGTSLPPSVSRFLVVFPISHQHHENPIRDLPFPPINCFHFFFRAQPKMHLPSFLSLLTTLLMLAFSLLSLPCISISKPHQQQQPMSMDPYETETLFHVMETLSSDRDWRSTNPDPCKPGSLWPGIECRLGSDGRLHVTRLDFGSTPNPSCKEKATFPSEVFDLPQLQSLFFRNCFTSAKTSLAFPAHKVSVSLQQLSFRSNPGLVGLIPPQISSLKSLQVLALSQNRLFGRIPSAISGLTSLIHLDLSYNSFAGNIPGEIGGMRSLVDLDLSYNSLTGTIPPSIGQLGFLQKLDLSSNSLTGAIPDAMEDLGFLSFLALSNNKLSGGFPKGLPKLRNLQYLIMDDNPMFVPLPFQLGRLARLQELRLANSGYSGSIPNSFAWLANLTTLSLENNRLTGAIPAGLGGLGRIYHMNLSRNLLGGVVPLNEGFIRRLGRNLDLSGNPGLCLSGSEGSESSKVGVSVCDANNMSSTGRTMSNSGGSPCLPCRFPLVLSYLGIWALYNSLI